MEKIQVEKKQERTFIAEDIKAIIEGIRQILDIYEKIVHYALSSVYTIKPIEFDESAKEAVKIMKDTNYQEDMSKY